MNVVLPVPDASYVAGARREVESTARKLGLDADDTGRASLVATELATNLARHGGGGEILLRPLEAEQTAALEMISLDRGPGLGSIAESLRDGSSTYGSAGTGLGAIRRQSDEFDIYSRPGQGTVVLSRIWPQRRAIAERAAQVGAVSVPKPEEQICGDSLATLRSGNLVSLMVVDGLGHGVLASNAAEEARRLFSMSFPSSPAAAIQRIHAGLRATRGAAVAVLTVDLANSKATYCGIGNIAGMVASSSGIKRLVSMNGIAGHTAGRLQEFVYPCDGTGLLIVLHSDGISANWTLERYPGLTGCHPSLIAAVLLRDAGRRRDDATVLVLKRAPP